RSSAVRYFPDQVAVLGLGVEGELVRQVLLTGDPVLLGSAPVRPGVRVESGEGRGGRSGGGRGGRGRGGSLHDRGQLSDFPGITASQDGCPDHKNGETRQEVSHGVSSQEVASNPARTHKAGRLLLGGEAVVYLL